MQRIGRERMHRGDDPDLPNRLSDAGCSLFGNLVVKPGDERCVDEIIVSLHGGAFVDILPFAKSKESMAGAGMMKLKP